MQDTALAGLPRLVRVADEVRLRGQTLVAIAAAVALFWLMSWLLDQPVDAVRTALNLAIAAAVAAVPATVVSGRRLREGLAHTMPPPRLSVHETRAQSRERRTRLSGVLALAVVLLLVFDRAAAGEGRMAGLVAGLFAVVGAVDWREARRWEAAERSRQSLLYVLVRPNALVAPFGVTEVFEVPRLETDREAGRVEAGYPA
jgi:hypothetical protein